MAGKKTGISRELIIHPGETIADILEERGITQAELAVHPEDIGYFSYFFLRFSPMACDNSDDADLFWGSL